MLPYCLAPAGEPVRSKTLHRGREAVSSSPSCDFGSSVRCVRRARTEQCDRPDPPAPGERHAPCLSPSTRPTSTVRHKGALAVCVHFRFSRSHSSHKPLIRTHIPILADVPVGLVPGGARHCRKKRRSAPRCRYPPALGVISFCFSFRSPCDSNIQARFAASTNDSGRIPRSIVTSSDG